MFDLQNLMSSKSYGYHRHCSKKVKENMLILKTYFRRGVEKAENYYNCKQTGAKNQVPQLWDLVLAPVCLSQEIYIVKICKI